MHILEPLLDDRPVPQGDQADGAGVAAGRPKLGRVLGEDQVALLATPAHHRRQDPGHLPVLIEQRRILVQRLGHQVTGLEDPRGSVGRDGVQAARGPCR